MSVITRSTNGAKLHDAFADGDYTANPVWTPSGTVSVVSNEVRIGATGPVSGFIGGAVASLTDSDYVTFRGKLGGSVANNNNNHILYLAQTSLATYYAFIIRHNTNSSLVTRSGTTVTTFNSGITDTAYHDFAVKWTAGVLTLYIDGVLKATTNDATYTSFASPSIYWQCSPGDGTHCTGDDFCVMDSWNVTCSSLPTGFKLRVISDSGGTEVATATESSGTATVDLTGKTGPFPYYGVQVLNASNVVQTTLNPSDTVSGHTIAGTFGGDAYSYAHTLTTTLPLAVPVAIPTDIQKYSSGEFYYNDGTSLTYADGTSRIAAGGGSSTLSIAFGRTSIASTETGASYDHSVLRGIASSTNGQTNVTVDDNVAVSAEVGALSSNSAHAADLLLYQDSSNWYRLEVAKTAGGTSTVYKKAAGSESAMSGGTISKGIDVLSFARVMLARDGSDRIFASVDGTQLAAPITDASPLSGPFTIRFGAPAASGTSDCHVANINVTYGAKVRVLGLSGTMAARAYNAAGTVKASSGTQSSGVATLDLVTETFPFTGYVKVFTDNTYATEVTNGRWPESTATTSFYGGDDLYYQLSGMTVLQVNAEATYPSTQTGSHNGTWSDAGVYTYLTYGDRGRVILGRYDSNTGVRREANVGSQTDMHSTCDLQRDSTGIWHIVYGGSTFGQQTTKYRKSNTTDPFDLGSEQDLGAKIRGSLLIDQADVLYLVGSQSSVSAGYDKIVCMKRSGGSWGAVQTIVNADTSNGWSLYPCDATIGKESSGQKTLHMTFMAQSSGTGFEHAFYIRSTDAAANWKGITGSNFTLPLSQTTATGLLSDTNATIVNGDAGVSRIAVDDSTFSHQVNVVVGVPGGSSSASYVYYRGTPGSAWPGSPTYTFNFATTYSNHPAIERYGNYLVVIACIPGSNQLSRWISSDNGASFAQSQLLAQPSNTRDKWWWPKLTPVVGAVTTKVVWAARGTVYANKNGASPLSGAGTGALALSTIIVTPSVSLPLAVAVNAASTTQTKTLPLAVKVFGRITTTLPLAVAVTAGPGAVNYTERDVSAAITDASTTAVFTDTTTVADMALRTTIP